jgi:hypothetical protein
MEVSSCCRVGNFSPEIVGIISPETTRMPRSDYSDAFLAVRDAIFALDDDRDPARLAGLFGHVTAQQRNLGVLRDTLRAIAALDEADLARLMQWFSMWMNTVIPLRPDCGWTVARDSRFARIRRSIQPLSRSPRIRVCLGPRSR